ncbi:MAG TPA: diguanylate cyclase, partial [Gallionella sp.]|nr:diguanylate cyclase [Gallionella sp.]
MWNLNELHEKLSLPLRLTLAVATFVLALVFRIWLLPAESGLAFMTFYPAIIISFYLFGTGPSILVAILSAAVAHFILIPPFRIFFATSSGDIAVVNFLLSAAMIGIVVRKLQDYARRVSSSVVDLRIAATAFETHESLMITDANRVILRVNQAFTTDTGYTSEEVVGQTPRILKSGRHNADFYREMWETVDRTGTWQGEIWDRRKNGDIYPKWLSISAVKSADGAVTHYIGSHIDISDRKSAEKEVHLLAFYDPLTQLPNRRLFMDRFHHALASSARNGGAGALLFIDLDNFKSLNDSLGHDIGDLMLQQVGQRLASCVRGDDTVSRLGGDEFVVMLENLSEHLFEAAAQTEFVCEKMLTLLSQSYQLETHEYHGGASIGATLFKGNSLAPDELLKQADIAMYQAKQAGRNTVRFFD